MAIDINGETLIITLEAGVTAVDVQEDLYKAWKTWMLAGNMRFPPAFTTSGGEEVTDVLNSGAYFFLQNQLGWRICPPEEDITIYLTGNLAAGTTSLPVFIPTIGDFTTGVLGIQPITQGVTDEIGTQVANIDYLEKAVWVDTGAVPVGNGSQASPFNTLTAAIDYAESTGINVLYLYDDIVLDRQLKNFRVIGVGNPTVDTNGQILTKTEFWHCKMEGTYVGAITVQESVLLNNFYLNGYFEKCGLGGDLVCIANSEVVLVGCISVIPGLGRPTISMNGVGTVQLSLRKNGGGMTIKDCNQPTDTVTVEVSEGSLTFDASCTDGEMVARGSCKFVDETTGATVTDETIPVLIWTAEAAINLSVRVAEAWQLLGLDASNPLVVSATQQIVDAITINVTGTDTKTATRV